MRIPSTIVLLILAVGIAVAQGPGMPLVSEYEYAMTIGATVDGSLDRVSDMAVDGFGNLFVVGSIGGHDYRIDIFQANGAYYGNFVEYEEEGEGDEAAEEPGAEEEATDEPEIKRPLTAAIDGANRLLIGTSRDGLLMFDGEGNYAGKIGEEQKLKAISCVRVDSEGNIYVAARGAKAPLLKFDAEGSLLHEYARSVVSAPPTSMAVDGEGRLYLIDGKRGLVRVGADGKRDTAFKPTLPKPTGRGGLASLRVGADAAGKAYVTIPTGRRGDTSELHVLSPEGKRERKTAIPGVVSSVLTMPDGTTYVAAQGHLSSLFPTARLTRVVKYQPDGREVVRFGADLTAGNFNRIVSMAALSLNRAQQGGDLIVCDRLGTMHRIAPSGEPSGIFTQWWPCAIAAGPNRSLYRITGTSIARLSGMGTEEVEKNFRPKRGAPGNMTPAKKLVDVAAAGNRVFALDQGAARVYRLDAALNIIGDFREIGEGGKLSSPSSIALSPDAGILYVVELGGKRRLLALDPQTGAMKKELVAGLTSPTLVRVGPDGGVFVLDKRGKRVVKYSPEGEEVCVISKAGDTELKQPIAMAVNPFGYVFIGDSATSRVHAFAPVK